MRHAGHVDPFILGLDEGHPARAWSVLNEGGIVGGSAELAVQSIRAAGLAVRVLVEADEASPDAHLDGVTVIVGRHGNVIAATAS